MAEARSGVETDDRQRTLRGILTILATGIVLGLGYNALGQQGKLQKGLAWIGEEKTLDRLEDAPKAGIAAGAPAADPKAATAEASDLPVIPDVGRPLQAELAGVRRFFEAKAALFIDAREPDEYAEGHIPGSLNLPFDRSVTDPAALETIDSGGKPIIVYCGGGACELSMNLAFALVQAGHPKVLVYMGGYPEWTAAGLPVVKGEGQAS